MSKNKSLSSSKKISSSSVISLALCILLVAAIGAILYNHFSRQSTFLTDKSLSISLSEIFEKSVRGVSKKDVESIRYLSTDYDSAGGALLVVGFDDFADLYEAEDPNAQTSLKTAPLANGNMKETSDLKYFTGIKYLSLYTPIADFSVLDGMKELNTLSLVGTGISDLTPIARFTTLRKLFLPYNSITDLAPIAALSELNAVDFSANKIEDISPLAQLEQLQGVYLSQNKISDVSALSRKEKLETLVLSANEITDISPIGTLPVLAQLDLSSNQISDITPLSGMDKLSIAMIYSNEIEDPSALATLPELTQADLSQNKLSDISSLANLNAEKIEYLGLADNQIEDWSAVEHLGDKVVRSTETPEGDTQLPDGYTVDEDGNITLSGDALDEFLAQQGGEDEQDPGADEAQ